MDATDSSPHDLHLLKPAAKATVTRFDRTAPRRYLSGVSDALFPSGRWVGYYTYESPADRHRMTMQIEFNEGRMTGEGTDDVATFEISGRYDAVSCACDWTKVYPASHQVAYHGYREGKGIWGRWEIGLLAHGGFHIWPWARGEGEDQVESAGAVMLANTALKLESAEAC